MSGTFIRSPDFASESTRERKEREARERPQAKTDYEAKQRAVDERTRKLREMRLAKPATDRRSEMRPD